MSKTKIVICIFAMLCLSVFLTCSGGDNTNQFEELGISIKQDKNANVHLINNTDEYLIVYVNQEPFRIIHKKDTPFKLYIPNPNNERVLIWIFKLEEVKENIDNPDLENIYKTVSIVVEENTSSPEIVNIEKMTVQKGKVTFYYKIESPDYNPDIELDVYINGRKEEGGEKICTLKAGEKKIVELEYGTYTLHYYYVDPLNSEKYEWIDTVKENRNRKEIYLSVDDQNQTQTIIPILPKHNLEYTSAKDTSLIRIKNNHTMPLIIYLNNMMIGESDKVITKEAVKKDVISKIEVGKERTYEMENGEYLFFARDYDEKNQDMNNITLKNGKLYEWEINPNDNTPPEIEVIPKDETKNVKTSSNIIITFSEPMSKNVTEDNIIVKRKKDHKEIKGYFMWNYEKTRLNFIPNKLHILTEYKIMIMKQAKDISANDFGQVIDIEFETSPLMSENKNYLSKPVISLSYDVLENKGGQYEAQNTHYNINTGFFSMDKTLKKEQWFRLRLTSKEEYNLYFINLFAQKSGLLQLFPVDNVGHNPILRKNRKYTLPPESGEGYQIGEPLGRDVYLILLSKLDKETTDETIIKPIMKTLKDNPIDTEKIESILDISEVIKNDVKTFADNKENVIIYAGETISIE